MLGRQRIRGKTAIPLNMCSMIWWKLPDADGFNHRFVDEMNFSPTDVTLTIRNQDGTPLTDEICDIWAFGFDGQIQFEDGVIRAWSEAPLESGAHMTVMVALERASSHPCASWRTALKR